MLDSLVISEPQWFCLRSQPKHEHIAAAGLRQLADTQVFCPRIRFQRATRLGPQWITESLFPSYLFARFDPIGQKTQVRYARGVAGIVHFGEQLAAVPANVIEDLRSRFQDDEMLELAAALTPGDEVKVIAEAFAGLEAVVTQVMPARQRVKILLEFLGRTTEVEVGMKELIRRQPHPLSLSE